MTPKRDLVHSSPVGGLPDHAPSPFTRQRANDQRVYLLEIPIQPRQPSPSSSTNTNNQHHLATSSLTHRSPSHRPTFRPHYDLDNRSLQAKPEPVRASTAPGQATGISTAKANRLPRCGLLALSSPALPSHISRHVPLQDLGRPVGQDTPLCVLPADRRYVWLLRRIYVALANHHRAQRNGARARLEGKMPETRLTRQSHCSRWSSSGRTLPRAHC